ncbi:MAG: hypothetical protein U5O39_11295 [Gammaproteobacteria bacterium]|nr:hypothetical protein [Gammaproteobacteria bacterium]
MVVGSTNIRPATNETGDVPALGYQTDPGVRDYLFDGDRHNFDHFAAATQL